MRTAAGNEIEWPGDVATARAIQEALRSQVVREDRLGPVNTMAGAIRDRPEWHLLKPRIPVIASAMYMEVQVPREAWMPGVASAAIS